MPHAVSEDEALSSARTDTAATDGGTPATTASTASDSGGATGNDEVGASNEMVIQFVDVGQGDATVVEFPDGKTLMVDAGRDGAAPVTSTLSADSRAGVDWLVATHPDSDHIGGLPDVLASCEVGSVWAPRLYKGTATYRKFLEAVRDRELSIDACVSGKAIAKGDDYSIELLWPPEDASYEDSNAHSAIIRVTYGSTSVLLCGDAPVEAIERANPGHVDVLKVSHHGSSSGTSRRLANELSPGIAVISYGTDNDYGHPTLTTLEALEDAGAAVYGTGAQGTVTVRSDGKTVSVSTEREGDALVREGDSWTHDRAATSAAVKSVRTLVDQLFRD